MPTEWFGRIEIDLLSLAAYRGQDIVPIQLFQANAG
jgi:hypothetical protein